MIMMSSQLMNAIRRNVMHHHSLQREGFGHWWWWITTEPRHHLHTSSSLEAARKGTREKARKKKVKVEVQKVGFIPHNLREKKIDPHRVNRHFDDSWKQTPSDNCYFIKFYRWPVYTIQEAIKCHRESHHPTMLNEPSAPLMVDIELNMMAEKSTKFLDNFQRMIRLPHKYEHGEDRRILVFSKGEEELASAREAGATLAGNEQLIKQVTNGELLLADYQHIIAHPNILPELVTLRGLMKRRFPSQKAETLGVHLAEMVKRFAEGISYKAVKDDLQEDFGLISVNIGPLDMDVEQLEENIIALLKDVDALRPKRPGRFITRVLLKSPPARECFKIDPFVYVPETLEKTNKSQLEISAEDTIVDNNQISEKIAMTAH